MKTILILLLLLITIPVLAQERMSFREADSMTYQLYEKGEWLELSKSSKKAIASGHDYYYMRMRAGISFFNRKKYFKALDHFIKALEFNSDDRNALIYIFWCHHLSGDTERAKLSLEKLSPVDAENSMKESMFKGNSFTAGYFYTTSNTSSLIESFDDNLPSLPEGSQTIPLLTSGIWTSFSGSGSNGLSTQFGLSYLHRKNWLYYKDSSSEAILPEQDISQVEAYLASKVAVSRHLTISPIIHYVGTRFDYPFSYSGPGSSRLVVDRFGKNQLIAGLGISSTFSIFEPGAEIFTTVYDNTTPSQITGSLRVYPLGNRNLYAAASYSVFYDGLFTGMLSEYVSGVEAGVLIKGGVWIESFLQSGALKNMILEGGKLVFNGMEEINLRYGISLTVPLKSGLSLFSSGILYRGESVFTETLLTDQNLNRLKFNNITITGGLKWKF